MRDIESIVVDVLACAASWEPEACLVGNVRADEIAALARAVADLQADLKYAGGNQARCDCDKCVISRCGFRRENRS